MAFKLRSSSPVLQEKKPSANALKEYQDKKFGKQKVYTETPMLNPSGKTEYKLIKNGKDITGSGEFQKYKTNQKMASLEKRQDYETKNKADILMADPTGISSWGDAKRGLQHIGLMAETGNWKKDRLLKDALDIVSAVPLGSKVKAAKAGLDVVKKAGTRTPKLFKAAEAAKNAKLTTAAAIVAGDKMSEAISNKNMTDKNKKSPAMQKKTAAWTRKEGKDPKGGLNAKGVASYRRENPGSKLQTAVTKKPSELKPGSKDAKRRKSFCARMSGMPGPLKDEKGRPTRKKLALDKWNC